MSTTINKSIFLAATRETVWEYLTDKDKLGEWFHSATENLVEGKPYALLGDVKDADSRMCWGDVLSARKPSFLTWTIHETPDSSTSPFFCSGCCEGAEYRSYFRLNRIRYRKRGCGRIWWLHE